MGHAAGSQTIIDRRELSSPAFGRIDIVLAEAYPDLSRARIQRLIEAGAVTLNGAPVRKASKAVEGDTLVLEITETERAVVPPTGLKIRVLFEDQALLAIDKPPGLAVHGAPGDTAASIAGWFLERYPEAAKAFEAERPGVVHRLDKDTTGVLLMAKTPQAQAFVSQAFEERRTTKTYLAIVEGVPTRPRAVIDAPLGRHPGDRTRMAIVNDGREARTEYELLGSGQDLSLLLVHLYTGRTHQIRVHLSAIGHPVSGDVVYGTRETRTAARGAAGVAPSQVGVRKSQLLHAWQLRVPHPDGGTLIATAPLPADMGDVLRANGMTVLAQEYGRSLGGRILPDASEAEPDEEA